MARQRASAVKAAFDRIGQAQVPALSDDASVSASGNDGVTASLLDVIPTIVSESSSADAGAGLNVSSNAGRHASVTESGSVRKKTGKKAGRPPRRVGRPRGPERVPLTIRILAQTDARLTAAVEATGQSPQYIVDAALAAYFDQLGVTAAAPG